MRSLVHLLRKRGKPKGSGGHPLAQKVHGARPSLWGTCFSCFPSGSVSPVPPRPAWTLGTSVVGLGETDGRGCTTQVRMEQVPCRNKSQAYKIYIYIILYTLQVVCCTRCQSLWSVLGAGSLQSVTTMFVSCSIRRSARHPDSWQIRGVDARVGARGTPKARTKWNQDEGQCCSTTSQFRSGWSAGEGSGSMFYATWGYDALMPSMNQSQARVKGRTGSTVMQALRCGR